MAWRNSGFVHRDQQVRGLDAINEPLNAKTKLYTLRGNEANPHTTLRALL